MATQASHLSDGARIRPSRSYELVSGGKRYPPKAILGTAYELATGHRLSPGDFEGGKTGAVAVLENLGFDVEAKS